MKHFRMLAAGLCSAVLLCGFAIPAYAYSDGGNEEPPVVEETPAPEPAPTITPGEGFSEDGNLVTRDLLYDAATNKQFITVETSGGNTFYIVIDYDKPVDEDGEQYHTYFLNMVDEADLLAALEAAGGELPACSCTEKCAPGAIHTDCEVCAVNMTECAGTAPEPAPVTEPAEEPEPEPQQKSNTGTLALIGSRLTVAAGNLCLHLSEHLLTDDTLMIIFNVVLRKLPGVFLMYTRQHILGKGLLQQHIPTVFFVLQDALDALC